MKNKKYELIEDNFILHKGKKLYRIKALREFETTRDGVVPKGETGGYVEGYRNLSQKGKCWIFYDSKVYGSARVKDGATLGGEAEIYGNAVVKDIALVGENAMVYDNAVIEDEALVGVDAKVYGNARVSDHACIYENASVYGNAVIGGEAVVVEGYAKVYDNAVIKDDALVEEDAEVYGNAEIKGNVEVRGCTTIPDSKVHGNTAVRNDMYENLNLD